MVPARSGVATDVDRSKCVGHGMCYSLAPAIFTDDDEGHSEVRGDGAVPADLAAEARVGAASCPELAITLG